MVAWFKKYYQYIGYVLRHKFYVFRECWRVGLYRRAFLHDLSKFLPSELIPYANYFYPNGEKRGRRSKSGYYKPTDTGDQAFDFAWLLHQKRNRHHWQWWILPEDEGGVKILPMSEEARQEMLADWRGAGAAQGFGRDPRNWYNTNRAKMQLNPETAAWFEEQLGVSGA